MLVSPPVKWFIDEGYLANYDYFIPEELDTSKFHHSMGDFSREDLKKIRISSFVKSYKEFGKDKPGISFGVDIEDAERIAGIFTGAGYPMKAVHSKMKDDLHESIMNNKLISSCDAIGEGVDIKGISVEIDARPTESMVIKRQHTGRVLRADWAKGHDLSTKQGRLSAIEESGKRAIILDFVSNYQRHGLPDDPYEWTLDTPKKKEKDESLYKRCPDCQRPVLKFDMICPACGYVFMKRAAVREPIKEKDGNLININSGNKAEINKVLLAIARGARKKETAYTIGRQLGASPELVDKIWHVYLRKA
jgi:superfamily II DNA or RNA helicase